VAGAGALVFRPAAPYIGLGLAVCSCLVSCTGSLAPYGEAVVIVDTDLPPATLTLRLRVDTYTADGVWLDSRDIARTTSDSWPLSFGVYETDLTAGRNVRVRLRAYPEGLLRDYRGERFTPRPTSGAPTAIVSAPPPTAGPRLIEGGVDVTPPTEPAPGTAVDRLIDIDLTPGARGSVSVLLSGACVGTMANLASDQTCIDTENVLVPTPLASLSPDLNLPSTSQNGTYGIQPPCNVPARTSGMSGTVPLHDGEACVVGGPFILGSSNAFGAGNADGELDGLPEIFAVGPTTLIDQDEVTVARWREALAEGFSPPFPVGSTEGPLLTSPPFNPTEDGSLCTYSAMPSPGGQDREEYPLNCVRWDSARAFCQFIGSDLLTEAEWEYAATASNRPEKTQYVWGDGVPSCADAIYGRDGEMGTSEACLSLGFGPQSVLKNPPIDVTPDGVAAMMGSLSEHVLDSAAAYDSVCWETAGLENPMCAPTVSDTHVIRGESWQDDMAPATFRYPEALSDGNIVSNGFRCARAGVE
jgi:formylglycine-generating enzyme required for sulfatase activity